MNAKRETSLRPPARVLKKARELLEHKAQAERERIARYGEVRPIITHKAWGKRFVAVRNKLYERSEKGYFSDFLRDFVALVFGEQWGISENERAEPERHFVTQWRIESARYMNTQPLQPDGSRCGLPSGPLAALMAFAYDLYIVADNGELDELLLHRLKHRELFQGARHELYAEATCLRAGFTVEHENERDGAGRHAEFTARHRATGQLLSIEAKSKHHAGVLGMRGDPQPHGKLSLRFGSLINDAIAKDPPHPLVIFMDTNLPFRTANHLYANAGNTPSRIMQALLDRVKREHGGRDPYAMIVFSNHPHHYAAKDELDPQKHLLSVLSDDWPEVNQEALWSLHRAANLYGNIPNEFPQ